jgi:hypothetical protein
MRVVQECCSEKVVKKPVTIGEIAPGTVVRGHAATGPYSGVKVVVGRDPGRYTSLVRVLDPESGVMYCWTKSYTEFKVHKDACLNLGPATQAE